MRKERTLVPNMRLVIALLGLSLVARAVAQKAQSGGEGSNPGHGPDDQGKQDGKAGKRILGLPDIGASFNNLFESIRGNVFAIFALLTGIIQPGGMGLGIG